MRFRQAGSLLHGAFFKTERLSAPAAQEGSDERLLAS